ncbi:hypothetical protein [Pseudoduganella chitinolytica]|uniref:hypothetical protein n=1 Tax=Pseudoduganella chitinolytica TaxID=34070 RepID=UPI0027D95E47|nr:hypothetical protein [Pseudoduganella chitinolytica]
MNPALQLLLLWLVLQAAVTDLAIRRIPNVLVLAGLLLSAALHGRTGPTARCWPRGWPAWPPAFSSFSPCMRCAAWPPATSS